MYFLFVFPLRIYANAFTVAMWENLTSVSFFSHGEIENTHKSTSNAKPFLSMKPLFYPYQINYPSLKQIVNFQEVDSFLLLSLCSSLCKDKNAQTPLLNQ